MKVVLINGREVSSMTHDQVRMTVTMIMVMMVMIMKMINMTQVVNFIRAAREPHSGSLVLAVRQVRMIKRLPDLCLQT